MIKECRCEFTERRGGGDGRGGEGGSEFLTYTITVLMLAKELIMDSLAVVIKY